METRKWTIGTPAIDNGYGFQGTAVGTAGVPQTETNGGSVGSPGLKIGGYVPTVPCSVWECVLLATLLTVASRDRRHCGNADEDDRLPAGETQILSL